MRPFFGITLRDLMPLYRADYAKFGFWGAVGRFIGNTCLLMRTRAASDISRPRESHQRPY